jgi:hypothetical protein
LKKEGFSISKSAIHRYGQSFQKQLETIKIVTEQAKILVENIDDEENNLAEALTRLAQQKAFSALVELEDTTGVTFPELSKSISELNKTSIANKKYSHEVKTRIKAAAEDVEKVARSGGVSDSTIDEIKRRILGISDPSIDVTVKK